MGKDGKRFNFTQAAIKALPTPEKLTFYYDLRTRGLAVAVMPSGTRVFYFYRRVDGKPTQIKIGAFSDLTVEQAREQADIMNGAIGRKEDPTKATGRQKGEKSFGEAFDWWVESYAKPRRKSVKEDQDVFRRYLGPLAKLRLSQVTKAELRKLHADLGSRVGQRTANKVIELVRAVLNRAISHDLLEGTNPALAVEMFELQSRDRRLLPSELPAFFQAIDEELNPDIRDYVLLSLFSGARQSNILAMRWDQIDVQSRVWRIPESKNGRPILIPLEPDELDILARRRKDHGGSPWVFPGRTGSKHGHLIEPKSGWARILKRVNALRAEAGDPPLSDIRIHDLRRTLGSFMVDTGASLPTIGKALGHQSQAATMVYARIDVDPVRQAKAKALEAMAAARQAGASTIR